MWPQWIMIFLTVLNLGMAIEAHGKPRSPNNAWVTVISFVIVQGLLIWGGFYTGLF